MAIKTKGKSTTPVSSWWEERRKVLAGNTKPARSKPISTKARPKPVRAKPKAVKAKSKPVGAKPVTKARTASKNKKIVKTVSKTRKASSTKKDKKR